MDKFNQVIQIVLGLALIFGILAVVFMQLKKSMIETGVQIQCSSGDSEVIVFNLNFLVGEPEDKKQAKIDDAFGRIEARREANHLKWLEAKAKAIEENEAQAAGSGKLKKLAEGGQASKAEFNGA